MGREWTIGIAGALSTMDKSPLPGADVTRGQIAEQTAVLNRRAAATVPAISRSFA